MKKTYFVNSKQITDISINFEQYKEEYYTIIKRIQQLEQNKKLKEEKISEFCNKYATKLFREKTKPEYFYTTEIEMNGKFGFFPSQSKYNLPEYYTGYKFQNATIYNKFLKLFNHI
jgi:hypothetical protein